MNSKPLLCLALGLSGGLTFFMTSCKRSDSTSKFDGQLGVPLTMYDFSKFTNFKSFQARIEGRYVLSGLKKSTGETNFLFSIVLQKTNGEEFAVYQDPASQKMIQVINSLEKGHSYIFPNVLMGSNQENVAR